MVQSDGQLYTNYLMDDDSEALRKLFVKYRDSLMLFLYRIVSNREDAEELMMDTFAIISSKAVHYKETEEASFKTWLFTIARNLALMHLRNQKVFLELPDDDDLGVTVYKRCDDVTPERSFLIEERNRQLYIALKELESDMRQVLYLMYFEGLKPNEISYVMHKSVKQIYNLTARGKAALREILKKDDFINFL